MWGYLGKLSRLIMGLFLFAFGSLLTIQANIGLAPWEAFSIGISYLTGQSYGNIVVMTSVVIVLIDLACKEKIGVGTLCNAVLIGKFVDMIQSWAVVPLIQGFWLGVLVMLTGLLIICLGSYFYIGAGLGCGPRDALMVAISKRASSVPIGVVRSGLEGSVLLIGWLLGAKIGVGTIIAVFGIGILLQGTFRLLRFDVKAVHHESLFDTFQPMQRELSAELPRQEQRK